MARVQVGPGDTQSLWSAKALSTIAAGDEATNSLDFNPGPVPSYGVFTMSFDTPPTAVSVDVEFSEGGNTWKKLRTLNKVAGESFTLLMSQGRYRAKLVSKTGSAELLTLSVTITQEITESLSPSSNDVVSPFGAECRIRVKEQEFTLNTGGANTDTAGWLPANSVLLGMTTRVTEAINTATGFSVADATTAARFSANAGGLTLGSTRVCTDHLNPAVASDAAGPRQPSAGTLRITTAGGQNTTGKVRVTLFYIEYVPALS